MSRSGLSLRQYFSSSYHNVCTQAVYSWPSPLMARSSSCPLLSACLLPLPLVLMLSDPSFCDFTSRHKNVFPLKIFIEYLPATKLWVTCFHMRHSSHTHIELVRSIRRQPPTMPLNESGNCSHRVQVTARILHPWER